LIGQHYTALPFQTLPHFVIPNAVRNLKNTPIATETKVSKIAKYTSFDNLILSLLHGKPNK